MTKTTITTLPDPDGFSVDPLTDILRAGARDLIQQAVEAELSTLLEAHSEEQMPDAARDWLGMATCRNAR